MIHPTDNHKTSMLGRIKLFVISMLPMWLVLFIKTVNIPYYFGRSWRFAGWDMIITIPNSIAFVCFALLALSLWYLHHLTHRLKGSPSALPVIIEHKESINIDYINTLSTLVTLFSALLVQYETIRDIVLLVVFLAIIMVCYTKTNLYYCNSVFAALGFRIIRVNTNGNCKVLNGSVVLYRGDLGNRISVHHLADNVFIQISNDKTRVYR